jgi:hypothetical protein
MFCLRTFCPSGRFFICGPFVPPVVLSHPTFGLPEILSHQTFCPSGGFIPPDVLSHGCYVSGCYIAGHFVSGCFVPPDVMFRTFVWAPCQLFYFYKGQDRIRISEFGLKIVLGRSERVVIL